LKKLRTKPEQRDDDALDQESAENLAAAAPSAMRIEISRDRVDARASIRLATLKHAMNSRSR